MAKDALISGESHQVVLNVANDLVVQKFLDKKIIFNDIPRMIEQAISNHPNISNPTLNEIEDLSNWTKEYLNREVIDA